MKKYSIIIALTLALVSCENNWSLEYIPTTPEEEKACLEHAQKILSTCPQTLSGDDQDYEDVIRQAHIEARITICRPTLWEHKTNLERTGNWKYVEGIK